MDQARRTQAQTSEGSGIPPGSADVSLKWETKRVKRSHGQVTKLERWLPIKSEQETGEIKQVKLKSGRKI